jgi:vacuolar-type H+-ATPase subunit E/Vma4
MQAEEAKAQLSALMRNEAELLAQRSRDTLQLQRREHEVTHLTAALQQVYHSIYSLY